MPRKTPRREPTEFVELRVLNQSRRRCALCFFFDGNLAEKLGHIAHLDDDRSNSAEDNLAFLCLEHHSLYDTTTSQHKGYTIAEAKEARRQLYAAIEQGRHLLVAPSPTVSRPFLETDRETFLKLVAVLPSGGSIEFMRAVDFGDSYRRESLDDLRNFEHERSGPEHEFLDPELEALRADLRSKVREFRRSLAAHSHPIHDYEVGTFRVPPSYEMRDPTKWEGIVEAINDAADAAVKAYDTLIRKCREKLA